MPGIPIQAIRESEQKVWSYGSHVVLGAVRFVTVDEILEDNPRIVLSQWKDLDLSLEAHKIPKYATISHSWSPSDEVQRLSWNASRPLDIEVGHETPHRISWHGLRQAAKAARHLGCTFLWLDLLCLHQTSSEDKKLQIKNMGHIYEKATAVIIMPGGVAAAQHAEHDAPWITRAWTLQEATLCTNVHVLILHDEPDPNYDHAISSVGGAYSITYIEGDLALSDLKSLLSSRVGVTLEKIDRETGKKVVKKTFAARCFGNNDAIITALEGVLEGRTLEMKRSAAWRSVWLRTSTKSQDMVFSVMHVLGAQIEVDYSRTLEDLIMELARKSTSLPSWLDIGDDIPFDARYGLVPAIPSHVPNSTPVYGKGLETIPVYRYVTRDNYISKFSIKVLTPQNSLWDGDIVCAEIFEVNHNSSGTKFILNGRGETHEYPYGEATGSHIMVIGDITVYGLNGRLYQHIGPAACYLKKSEAGIWERVPSRTCIPNSFAGTGKRTHLRIGGSQETVTAPCWCNMSDSELLLTYGMIGGRLNLPRC